MSRQDNSGVGNVGGNGNGQGGIGTHGGSAAAGSSRSPRCAADDDPSTSAEVLRTILDRLNKLDSIDEAVKLIGARVSALEEGAQRSAQGDEQSRTGRREKWDFESLEEPDEASKKMWEVSIKAAREKYAVIGENESAAAFRKDFEMWEEKHFNTADKKYVKELRDALRAQDHNITVAAFHPMSKALIEFRDNAQSAAVPGAMGEVSTPSRTVEVEGRRAGGGPPGGGSGDDSSEDNDHSNRDHNRAPRRDRRDESTADTRGTTYRSPNPKPTDVAKALPKDAMYQGGTTENIRRKLNVFTTTCRLAGLDLANESQIIDLMAVSWLQGAARSYFEDRLREVTTASAVVERLEQHFLHARARRINEERWNALTYQLVRSKQISEGRQGAVKSHESTLNLLFVEIDALADLRVTSERSDESILSKIIFAVRGVNLFRPVCLQPPNFVEEMKTLLRGVAVEADNKSLLDKTGSSGSASTSFVAVTVLPDSDTDENVAEAYLIDRKYLSGPTSRKVPGYGARYPIRKKGNGARTSTKQPSDPLHGVGKDAKERAGQRKPRGVDFTLRNGTVVKADQCIVCFETGCHSSNHKKVHKSYLAALFDEESVSDSEVEEEAPESTGYACFVSEARVCAYIGVSPTEPRGFVGMLVDTGASELSTVGEKWLPTLRTATGSQLYIRKSPKDIVAINGVGDNSALTKGSFECPFYFGHQPYTIRVYIVSGFSPFLLSHGDMDCLGISYHSLEKKIVRPEDGYEQDVVWHRNLPFLPFSSVSYLSEVKLRNIHRSLGHAPTDKVVRLLEVADESLQTSEIRAALKKIAQECKTCALTQPPPQRFLFSSRYEGIGSFNSTVFVDDVKLSDGKVLHVVCAGTGFQGAAFLFDASAESAWKALCKCWLNIYSGAPDDLYHDPGTNFPSEEFRNMSTALGITVHEVPTEAHHAVGAIERKHAMLRAVYDRVSLDEPITSREEKLQLTLRCVNDAPGPGGVSPTVLVFGVISKLHMPRKRNASLEARIRTIRECTLLARRLKAQRVRDEAARRRHVPNMANIRALEKLVPGDTVLVYREKEGWKPYPFVEFERDGVAVQLPKKISRFAVTACKPAAQASVTSAGDLVPLPDNAPVVPSVPATELPVADMVGEDAIVEKGGEEDADRADEMLRNFLLDVPLSGFNIAKTIPEDFTRARQLEMQGLYEHRTFKIVPEEESHGHRLYNYKYVDKVKPDGELKSRFCVQAFNDRAHGLLTFAPTIQRQSLRLVFAVGTSTVVATRDVSQAFFQSDSMLRRPVFVRPPPELELPAGFVLRILRPLYGMPEAPLHWFSTYVGHHKDRLNMQALCNDPCVLFTEGGLVLKNFARERDEPHGIVGIQVDDSIICGNKAFHDLEEKESKRFLTKKKVIIENEPVLFNGLLIWRDEDGDYWCVAVSKVN